MCHLVLPQLRFLKKTKALQGTNEMLTKSVSDLTLGGVCRIDSLNQNPDKPNSLEW